MRLITLKGQYSIGDYKIDIPFNFGLPFYQKKHKLYDRFLPVLANHLTSNKIIIDVGGNVGDTAIAILQHCNNDIICIEASNKFFRYLENNLMKLKPNDYSRVKTIKKLAGTGLLSGDLKYNIFGTANVIINNSNAVTHTALDNLIEDSSDIILLKVDTDGFDFDVLMSSKKILSNSEPILFWENYIQEDFQYNGYNELYSYLVELGYNQLYIFDNYGNLIIEKSDFNTLRSINSYLYNMIKNGNTKTFIYTDILATTDRYSIIAENAIKEYKSKWINKEL